MLLILQRPYKLTIHTSVRHTVATYKNTLFQPCRYIDNYAVASQSTALRPDIRNPTHTPAAAPAPLRFAPALTTVNMLRTHHCQHAPHAKSHNLPSLAPRMRRLLHPARVYWNHAENAKASALRPSRKHIPTTHSSPATHLHIRDLFCACCTTTNSTEVRHSQTSISSGCFHCSRPAQIHEQQLTCHRSLLTCGACCILHSCIGITPKMQRQVHCVRLVNIFQPPIALPQRIYTFAICSAHAALQPIQLKYAIPKPPSHPDVFSAHVLRRFKFAPTHTQATLR